MPACTPRWSPSPCCQATCGLHGNSLRSVSLKTVHKPAPPRAPAAWCHRGPGNAQHSGPPACNLARQTAGPQTRPPVASGAGRTAPEEKGETWACLFQMNTCTSPGIIAGPMLCFQQASKTRRQPGNPVHIVPKPITVTTSPSNNTTPTRDNLEGCLSTAEMTRRRSTMSCAICSRMPGRCTFTATSSPVDLSRPLYTYSVWARGSEDG